MLRKEKAPGCAATQTEAGMAEAKIGTIHQGNSNTESGRIARFLMHGQEHAIRSAELLQMTGLKTARELQQAIESERKHGTPILTKPGSDGGYFLPSEDPAAAMQECRNFVHFMRAKGLGCLRSMRPAAKLLAELQREAGGQERIVL